MSIEAKDIQSVLPFFNIDADVLDIQFFISRVDEAASDMNFIIKVILADERALVVKFIKQARYPHALIEAQSRFSEHLRSHGILTPRRYACGGRYCLAHSVQGVCFDITVEDYLGEAIHAIDHDLAFSIGQLMGKNHGIAERGGLHINHHSLFGIVGYNEVMGYDEFLGFGNEGLIDDEWFRKICVACDKKLNRIKDVWDDLPRYATQGDYAIDNLTDTGDGLGLFDYNNAGDEVLVSDMILEGLYTAREMDLADGLTDADRPGLFAAFANGYLTQRQFSEAEQSVFSDICAMAKGLWFTRILYRDDSLEALLKRQDRAGTSALLQAIYDDVASEATI